MLIFQGNDRFAYRDPACCEFGGAYYLFFTVSEKDGGYMFNRIAVSRTEDFRSWSEPVMLTEKDVRLNYCSPGNVIRVGDEYVLCCNSYPMPYPFAQRYTADETARLYIMRTKDFTSFTPLEPLNPKTDTPLDAAGRMIDPYIVKHDGCYHLFFKQNGVSVSRSPDFAAWEYLGSAEGGENACVLRQRDGFLLIHSPQNGIAFARSDDLRHWTPSGLTTLGQDCWPWAAGRITAGFAMEAPSWMKHRYILFFHGSCDVYPETHGNASLAAVFTDDFVTFEDNFRLR